MGNHTSPTNKGGMGHKYLNEYHKQRSLACEKAIEEMSKHPLSYEEKIRQIKALERAEKEGVW